MIHGRNLIVSINGMPVAGAKSCQFQISQDFLKVCSPTDGRTFGKVPTTYDWSMSVDCLIPSSTLSVSLVDKLIAGTRVLLTFTDGGGQNRAGFAYVKSCDESGSIGSLAKFSASFEADGALYKYTNATPARFTEGNDKGLGISSTGTISIYTEQGMDMLLMTFAVTQSKPNKLIIYDNDANWFVSNDTVSNVKSYINNNNGESLTDHNVAYSKNEQNQIVVLPVGNYVLVVSEEGSFGALLYY